MEAPGGEQQREKILNMARQFAEQVGKSGVSLTTSDVQDHVTDHCETPALALSDLPQLMKSKSTTKDKLYL